MILYDSGKLDVDSTDPYKHTHRLLANNRAVAADNLRQCVEVILIHPRSLLADCIMHSLSHAGFDNKIRAFCSVTEWLSRISEYETPICETDARETCPHDLVILLALDAEKDFTDCKEDLNKIFDVAGRSALVILLSENTEYVYEALEAGVRGFIPESLPLKIATQAIDLVLAGGTFVPSTALFRNKSNDPVQLRSPSFTGREAEVLDGLVRGVSNKIIAHDLGMSECTVKIHVRNIMRKLKARNRTHVAFIVHQQHIDMECLLTDRIHKATRCPS